MKSSEGVESLSREIVLALLVALSLLALKAYGSESLELRSAQPLAAQTAEEHSFDKLLVKLQDNFKRQISLRSGREPGEYAVSFEGLKVRGTFPLERIEEFQLRILGLSGLGSSRLDGLFSWSVLAQSKKNETFQFKISGRVSVVGPVLVATRNLKRGDELSPDTMTFATRSWSKVPSGGMAISTADLIGRQSRSFIQAGDVLFPALFEEAFAVKIGEPVELTVLSGPGVIIRSRGIARQAGRLGDVIRVEQPDTKKFIRGSVIGEKSVEVRL